VAELAMFPLGTVLFPTLFLPLHVFEPRYRELVRRCLADESDPEFGVVLIERGSEVGGADVRTDVGTVARILEAAELDDGRWVLGTVGTRRIRVRRWLADDPFPRAETEDWDDGQTAIPLADAYAEATSLLRRVLALKAEVGETAPPATVELADDPLLGSYQLAALSSLGPADQQKLLAADTPEERLDETRRMLAEEADFLAQRLAMG
jgi:Lon protease-like protein